MTFSLELAGRQQEEPADRTLRVFELSQDLRWKWIGANRPEKGRIVELVCLNLVLKGATLGIATVN